MLYKRGDKQKRIKYVGEFKDNKYDGYGSIEFYHGARYRGQWVYGKKEGRGQERTDNNSKYTGQFKNDKWHG